MESVKPITFADFFAGIGGFRLGLSSLNWKCVYTCEIDPDSVKTYNSNYNVSEKPIDISEIDISALPYFDVFCGGFPCQPFSIAGKRKGVDDHRGKFIGRIIKIAEVKKPKIVFLENVRNIISFNKGKLIKDLISDFSKIGYSSYYKVLNSKDFLVPQSRPRFFLIAVRNDLHAGDFCFPSPINSVVPVSSIIEKGDDSIPISNKWEKYIDYYQRKISKDDLGFDPPKTRISLERIDQDTDLEDCIFQMRSSGIRALSISKPLPTFAVSVSGGGAMIPVYSKERRHISILEIKRIMGFPDDFKFPVSRTFAIKQLANAVCPPVVRAIGESIENYLLN
jgi:DNA (cytosine-5)-methyltransferase 1